MGIKKIAIPINDAKNYFLKWLKEKGADSIDIYAPNDADEWDYYVVVSAFINDVLYTVYFEMWEAQIRIDFIVEAEHFIKINELEKFYDLLKNYKL